jgi:hypothetical protein
MNMTNFNEFAKAHGAKLDVFHEDRKFRYQNKSLRYYTASIFGLPFVDFPVAAFTNQRSYQQWCVQVCGVMPSGRKAAEFEQYIQARLAEAEEVEIPPDMEEGSEVGAVILNIVKNYTHNCRDFDIKGDDPEGSDADDRLFSGEWLFVETIEGSKCGKEVFIRVRGLMAKITWENSNGNTPSKITQKEVTDWLKGHGRYYDREASKNRYRSAYVLPLKMVLEHEIFPLREANIPKTGGVGKGRYDIRDTGYG